MSQVTQPLPSSYLPSLSLMLTTSSHAGQLQAQCFRAFGLAVPSAQDVFPWGLFGFNVTSSKKPSLTTSHSPASPTPSLYRSALFYYV